MKMFCVPLWGVTVLCGAVTGTGLRRLQWRRGQGDGSREGGGAAMTGKVGALGGKGFSLEPLAIDRV